MLNLYFDSTFAKIKRIAGIKTKLTTTSKVGNHDKYGNILFQGMHVKGYTGTNQEDWFLLNYGSSYDPATKTGSKDSSWSLTGQYKY